MKLTIIVLATLALFDGASAAFARGGGSNFMNSPGYQRALQESRRQLSKQPAAQTYLAPASIHHGRKWRKRGRR